MLHDTPRIKTLYIVAVVFCASAAALYAYLLFGIYQARAARVESAHATAEAKREADEAFQIGRSLRENKDTLAALDAYVVHEEGVPRFIEKLEALSQTFGVTLHLSSLSAEPSTLSVALSLEGRFEGIVRFVRAIELLPLRLEIGAVSFVHEVGAKPEQGDSLQAPTRVTGETSRWSATMTFRILSFRTKAIKK